MNDTKYPRKIPDSRKIKARTNGLVDQNIGMVLKNRTIYKENSMVAAARIKSGPEQKAGLSKSNKKQELFGWVHIGIAQRIWRKIFACLFIQICKIDYDFCCPIGSPLLSKFFFQLGVIGLQLQLAFFICK